LFKIIGLAASTSSTGNEIDAALQRALLRSDRNLSADFDDVVARKPEEIADVHGVSLHRGEESLLPSGYARPVLPVNDRFVANIVGDVVEIEGATFRLCML
jgi:hypothetical protein